MQCQSSARCIIVSPPYCVVDTTLIETKKQHECCVFSKSMSVMELQVMLVY